VLIGRGGRALEALCGPGVPYIDAAAMPCRFESSNLRAARGVRLHVTSSRIPDD
jgi:hypothetical protein